MRRRSVKLSVESGGYTERLPVVLFAKRVGDVRGFYGVAQKCVEVYQTTDIDGRLPSYF